MPYALTCTLVTPETTLFDGEAVYVAIPAHDGSIGVSPGRAPLLAELGYGLLSVATPAGDLSFFVAGGFVQVKDGGVTVLADEAMPSGDVDKAEAQRVLAEEASATAVGDAAIAERDRKARRARAILAIAG